MSDGGSKGGSGGGGGDGGGHGGSGKARPGTLGGVDPEVQNELLSHYLYFVLMGVSIALISWRLTTLLLKYVRHVGSLSNDTQRYFARTSRRAAWFKRNVLYSPIFRQRHNREFQLSSAINVGTLPTRMQLVFLFGYFATNVIFSLYMIDLSQPISVIGPILRNRTGVLATVNMIPLVVMAGRNNPLIKILGLSFDTFNLLHRWFGRVVILESICHVLFYYWAISAKNGGWMAAINKTYQEADPYLVWGWIGVLAFFVIGLQAASVPRHAFYEIFKMFHIALAALAIAGLYQHLAIQELPQLVYVIPAITLWMSDRAARFVRLAVHNVGSGGTKTIVEALEGDACRVTVTMARPWTFKPGQHAYLYMPTISLLQSHPFSVAWSDEADTPGEKLPLDRQDVLATRKTTMSFVIRARTGFTRTLYNKASACPQGRLVTTAMLEGPYGGLNSMHSYGTVMLFAGGVGITNAVPHVRDLVIGYSNGTVAARKIVLVWIIQNQEHLQWIRPWMTDILALDGRRECLRIMLFVTRPRSPKEIHSPSTTVQMFPGRPNIDTLIGNEMENQVGTLGVSVCGPGVLSDAVRRAVRTKQYRGNIDFVEEAFSW